MVISSVPNVSNRRRAAFTAERQARIRSILLGLVLFFGLAAWVFHSIGSGAQRAPEFVSRLRALGVMTWIYALVLIVDQRFYQSRFARRRREQFGIPENLLGWLLGQMLPWFGLVYFVLTGDLQWYVAGLVLMGWTFWLFPTPPSDGTAE
jgi:hypothetical protein